MKKILLVAFGLILGACGGANVATPESPETANPSSTAVAPSVSEVEEVVEEEDDQRPTVSSTLRLRPGDNVSQLVCSGPGLCEEWFVAEGRTYSIGCSAVREEAISDVSVGSGLLYGEEVEVRQLVGLENSDIVAFSLSTGCTEDVDEPRTGWSFAFVTSLGGAEIIPVVCEAGELSNEQRQANGCEGVAPPQTQAAVVTTLPLSNDVTDPNSFGSPTRVNAFEGLQSEIARALALDAGWEFLDVRELDFETPELPADYIEKALGFYVDDEGVVVEAWSGGFRP